MELDQVLFSQPSADVPARQDESNWECLGSAPLEDHLLALCQKFYVNTPETTYGASGVRVHSRIVETQIEALPAATELSQALLQDG